MPELPDIECYRGCLRSRIAGAVLDAVDVVGPSFLRSVDPPVEAFAGLRALDVERLGKRLVLVFEGDRFLVVHLMIAGRLRWLEGDAAPTAGDRRTLHARLRFRRGTLLVVEQGTRKMATMVALAGREALTTLAPGGVEPMECSPAAFEAALRRENRTLKRALTDPAVVAGIGNAYSDEILHAARLPPTALTARLERESIDRLHEAMRAVLGEWVARLADRFASTFPGPGDITAFRPEFAVHGRFGQPCRECGRRVQRIVRGDRETNYCPTCQTGGKVLADRALSRLLKDDWPAAVEE